MNFPIKKENWQLGYDLDFFVDSMQSHRLDMLRRLRTVHLSEGEISLLVNLDRPIHALVMSEDWCVDSLMNLPILVRIAQSAPQMDLRIFVRHEWGELDAYFKERAITNIPVFLFLDANFNEIGVWVEKSKAAGERLAAWVSEHPVYESIRTSAELSREEKRSRLAPFLAERQLEMEDWYNNGLQTTAVAEIAALLRK
ncbi:MAG: thioredoxin family protein [Anaerolineaceae bacterium]|nr:thioredoxin family protein [Anaerolineaceae bacterium]